MHVVINFFVPILTENPFFKFGKMFYWRYKEINRSVDTKNINTISTHPCKGFEHFLAVIAVPFARSKMNYLNVQLFTLLFNDGMGERLLTESREFLLICPILVTIISVVHKKRNPLTSNMDLAKEPANMAPMAKRIPLK